MFSKIYVFTMSLFCFQICFFSSEVMLIYENSISFRSSVFKFIVKNRIGTFEPFTVTISMHLKSYLNFFVQMS